MRTVKDVRDTEVQKDMVRTWSFYEVFGSVESITRMYVARLVVEMCRGNANKYGKCETVINVTRRVQNGEDFWKFEFGREISTKPMLVNTMVYVYENVGQWTVSRSLKFVYEIQLVGITTTVKQS